MKKALSLLLTVALSICSSLAYATVYTFTGNGSWSDAANWDSAKRPSNSILGGDTIVIQGNCTFSGSNSLMLEGVLRVANGGTLIIDAPGSIFESRNKLIVEGTLTIKSNITVYGYVDVLGILNNNADFNTVSVSLVTIMNGGVFNNAGNLTTYVTV